MNYYAHRFGAILAFASLCSCGGGGGGGVGNSVPPPAPAVTLSLSTTNGVVSVGQSVPVNSGRRRGRPARLKATGRAHSPQMAARNSSLITVPFSRWNAPTAPTVPAHRFRIEAIGTNSKTTSTVAYSSTGLSTLNYVILPIDGLAQVYDPANGLIHAITSATSSSYPQSLISIDPATAQVVASTPLSSVPWTLAVSADGQYLYVMATAMGSPVQRYTVSGLVPDLSIPLSSSGYAQGLSPSSASPTTIAVTSMVTVGNNPSQSQLQIFDGATPRANSFLAPFVPVAVTLLSPVWTADNTGILVPGSGINVFAVDARGVSLTKVVPVGGPFDGSLHGNVFYDNDGNVIDTAGPVALLGQIADHGKPISSQYVENLAIGKSFTLDSDEFQNRYLTSYSATQFYAIDSVQIPLANGLSGPSGGNVILWGNRRRCLERRWKSCGRARKLRSGRWIARTDSVAARHRRRQPGQ